jgi:hypothetical protein
MKVQLMKAYQARDNPNVGAVPFNVVDELVEITLSVDGELSTSAMGVDEFLEQFELEEVN